MATTTSTGLSAEDVYNQKLAAAKQLVENEYQSSTNALNESQAALAPTYQADRNSAYSNAAQSQKTAAQNYADLGLSRSGSMNTVGANINADRDNAVNTINSNETQTATALANRLAELNASKSQSLAGLESDYNDDLLNYNLEKSNLTGTLDGQSTLAAQELASRIKQYEAENALNEASLTGTYNGQQTLSAQQMANQQALNEANLTGTYNGNQTLTAQQMAQQLAQQALANKMSEANLTGTYNGANTMTAQELASQIASNKNEQALAQLQTLLNYNLGVGELTEAVPVVDDFTYGDAMTKLLAQIYGIS